MKGGKAQRGGGSSIRRQAVRSASTCTTGQPGRCAAKREPTPDWRTDRPLKGRVSLVGSAVPKKRLRELIVDDVMGVDVVNSRTMAMWRTKKIGRGGLLCASRSSG